MTPLVTAAGVAGLALVGLALVYSGRQQVAGWIAALLIWGIAISAALSGG
jgi:hypothetical protein